MSGRGTWRRARRGDPCPICQRETSCSQSPGGLRFCWGASGDANGWKFLRKLDNGFSLYVHSDQARGDPEPARHRGKCKPAQSDDKLTHEQLFSLLERHRCKRTDWRFFADQLSIHPGGLSRIGAGRVPGRGPESAGGYWLTPERDENGLLVGLQRRFDDGTKKAYPGGSRGLCYPFVTDGLNTSVILVVEGHSDTAAAVGLGLFAVGRPSNVGGAAPIAKLTQHAVQRCGSRLLLVGENDRKPSGLWPGKEGVEKVGTALANFLGGEVFTAFPPAGVKDLRGWVRSLLLSPRDVPEVRRREVGQQIVAELLATAATVTATTAALRLPPLPEAKPPTPDVVVELMTAGQTVRPCPSAFVPILQRNDGSNQFLGLQAHCKRWTCPVCRHRRRSRWMRHLTERFEAAGGLYLDTPAADRWAAMSRSLRRAGADYVLFTLTGGQTLLIVTVGEDNPVTPAVAAEAGAEAMLTLDHTVRNPICTSRGWKLIEDDREDVQMYERRGQAPRGGFGLMVNRLRRKQIEANVTSRHGVSRARWKLPDDTPDERVKELLDQLRARPHPTESPDLPPDLAMDDDENDGAQSG